MKIISSCSLSSIKASATTCSFVLTSRLDNRSLDTHYWLLTLQLAHYVLWCEFATVDNLQQIYLRSFIVFHLLHSWLKLIILAYSTLLIDFCHQSLIIYVIQYKTFKCFDSQTCIYYLQISQTHIEQDIVLFVYSCHFKDVAQYLQLKPTGKILLASRIMSAQLSKSTLIQHCSSIISSVFSQSQLDGK